MSTACVELVERAESVAPPETGSYGGLVRCGRAAPPRVVVTDTLDGFDFAELGRRPAIAGPYCTAHGGAGRAQREAESDWSVLAPASVGDEGAVERAGAMALDSRAVYLVLRREADEVAPNLWRVRCTRATAEAVGRVGAFLAKQFAPAVWHTPVEAEARRRVELVTGYAGEAPLLDRVPGRTRPRPRPWLAAIGIGGYIQHVGAYATRDEALAHGTEAWRVWVALAVRAIREARGGTLSWGLPVEPRSEPVLVEPVAGQSAYAAHRVAELLAAIPEAKTRRVPVCARWANGRGTEIVHALEAPEHATEIRGPGCVAYVHDSDLVYLRSAPAEPYLGEITQGARNASALSREAIVAELRG